MLVPGGRPAGHAAIERAEALLRVGRLADAAAAAREIVETTTGSERREALLVQSEALRWAHALDADTVAAVEAAGDEPGIPPAEAAQVLGVAATGWLHLSDYDRGVATARRALAAADDAADPTARCLALGPLGKGLLLTGRWAEAEEVLEEAVALARRSDDPLVHFGPVYLNYIQTVVFHGRFDEAEELMAEALHHAERLGLLPVQVLFRGGLMTGLVATGRWAEAPDAVAAWWDLAAVNDIHITSPVWCTRAARLALGLGELAEAQAWLERGELLAEHQPIPKSYQSNLARERALHLEATGRTDEALAHLQATRPRMQDSPFTHVDIGVTLARLSAAAGDLDTADEVAAAVEAAAANPYMPEIPFRAALCRALAGGPVDAALAAFTALDHDRAILIDLLLDQETLADVLAERGRRDDAVRLLHDATDSWEEIGAPFFAARTLAKLRALGVRRGARGSRDRPATGWEALTPTERQVADLILDGLTYREIGERQWISRRTVETHARHIFAKLGVANRRELAAHAPSNRATAASTPIRSGVS